MTTGAFQDAIKAFDNADTIQVTLESLFQKARCYIALNQLNDAIFILDRVLQISPSDTLVRIDLQVIMILQELQQKSSDKQAVSNLIGNVNELIKLLMDPSFTKDCSHYLVEY